MSGPGRPIWLSCSVGGTTVPVNRAEVTGGSYGSVGHATVYSDVSALSALRIDLVQLASATVQVEVLISVETPGAGTTLLFGGELVSVEWSFDTDEVQMHARDWAGVLVDQKRILARDVQPIISALTPLTPGQDFTAAGVSTMNRNISQVVADIATTFGLTPMVSMAAGTDTVAGSVYGNSDHVFMTIPQNMWSVLNTLARDTGNEVYVTPDRKLYFGPPGGGLSTIRVSWRVPDQPTYVSQSQTSASPVLPCRQLQITHNPRRNATFRVLVISYDPAKAQTTIGRATYVGDSRASKTVPQGLSSGAAAVQADAAIAADQQAQSQGGHGAGSKSAQIQLYTFHWDGLTTEQATLRAAAIATSISKRLLLMNCDIDGYPLLRPTQPLSLQSPYVPAEFTSNQWYVVGYEHRYSLPTSGSDGGFWTHIQTLDVPSAALSASAI